MASPWFEALFVFLKFYTITITRKVRFSRERPVFFPDFFQREDCRSQSASSGSISRTGIITKSRFAASGCGTLRSGRAIVSCPNRMMSRSSVRDTWCAWSFGRPLSASIFWQRRSNSSGVPLQNPETAAFVNSGATDSHPTGAVRYRDENRRIRNPAVERASLARRKVSGTSPMFPPSAMTQSVSDISSRT